MRRLLVLSTLILATAMASSASAVYNANMSGQVLYFWSYTDHDSIYFMLRDQPSSHPSCNPSFFVIQGAIPADRRKMMFARLSVAFAMQENINIGYDNAGDCADGYIRVHRVG